MEIKFKAFLVTYNVELDEEVEQEVEVTVYYSPAQKQTRWDPYWPPEVELIDVDDTRTGQPVALSMDDPQREALIADAFDLVE